MQCPECGSFHKHKDGMTCSCKYKFVTDPKVYGFGDKRIKNAVAKLSEGDSYFTQEELYCKCFKRKSMAKILVIAILMIIFGSGFYLVSSENPNSDGPPAVMGLICVVIAPLILLVSYFNYNKSDDNVVDAVNAYIRKYFPPNLLKTEKIKDSSFKQLNYEDFMPDHFLVVDCKETLAQLLTNGFHRDNNCLIMTSDKFPKKAFDFYKLTKQKNPDTKLHLFHDASLGGDMIGNNIVADSSWETNLEDIIDLGVSTDNLNKTKKGVWRKDSHLAFHKNKEGFIDEKLNGGWKYMIDSLPQGRLLALLGFAFETKLPLLSDEFHQAYLENKPAADPHYYGGDGGYDDFG
ncbi:MAG: hypothetical protein CMO57_10155 [Verrucomicrobiales bacterium]|nr:hypothetical protein [Verrucomicrobiales bacterium]